MLAMYPSLLRNYMNGNNPLTTDDDRFNVFKVFYAWYCQFQYNSSIHFAMEYELNIIILLFDIFQIIYNIDMKYLIDNANPPPSLETVFKGCFSYGRVQLLLLENYKFQNSLPQNY